MSLDYYMIKNQQKLRCGYTTGSCAAGAAKGAAYMLLTGEQLDRVEISVPKGWRVLLELEDVSLSRGEAVCAVRKDGGDDPDVTHGLLIYARVCKTEKKGIWIDGGPGVGRVTQRGLSIEVGQAAINPTPRAMIAAEVNQVCIENGYDGGILIEIFVPQGEELARKTFNPRLGIVGGISIIGTSGIVEPMSERALLESIRLEMSMLKEKGVEILLVVPGNYGEAFARDHLGLDIDRGIKSSNFVGDVLDFGVELGFKGILIVGHIGKAVKLAGGIMNLHSRNADGRMEILAAYTAFHGGRQELIQAVMGCATTDEGVDFIEKAGLLEPVLRSVTEKAEFYLDARVKGGIKTGIVLFSHSHGLLGISHQGKELLESLDKGGGGGQ